MRPAPIDPPEVHARLWEGFTGDVGWDVGANCGQSLAEMTSRFRHVVAFEPAVECYPYLIPWVTAPTHNAQVTIFQYALSDQDGQIQLAALPDKIDTGQLVTPGTHGMEWSPDVPAAVARTVVSYTIDSLIADGLTPPQFLKIDVEGHERHVLDGGRKTIANYRPELLIEFHTPELHHYCRDLLGQERYEVVTVRHPHYRPGTEMWFQHGWIRAFPR